MIIVVSDANIIIDLLQINLFPDFLKLNWEKYITPNVVDEVKEENSALLFNAINANQIYMPVFEFDDLQQIQNYFSRYAPLSVADCSCLHLAEKIPAILLTSERQLRDIAHTTHELEVHGTLWIIDHMIEGNIITHRQAHTKLTLLVQINPRLPKAEIEKRLRRWNKKL